METNEQNEQQPPFEGDAKIQEAQVLTLTRVEAMIQIAEKSFEQVFIEKGGEEKQKELVKKMKKVMALPKEETVTTLEEAKKVKREFAKIRTALEDARKEMKKDIIASGKGVDDANEKFKLKFTVHEDKLATFIEELETLQESQRVAEEKRIEDLKKNRIAELESNGCVFQGQWWAINDISLGTQQIQEMPDESWSDLIEKVKVQKQLNDDKAKKEKEDSDAKEAKAKLERDRFDKIKLLLSFIKEDTSKCADWTEEEFEKIYSEASIAKSNRDKEDEDRKNEIREVRIAQLEIVGIKFGKEHEKIVDESTSEEWKIIIEGYKKAKKDKEEKAESERKERILLAENSKPLEELGYKHDFKSETWNLVIGVNSNFITKEEMLVMDHEKISDIKSMKALWEKELEEKLEEERLDNVFKTRKIELLNLGFIINQPGVFQIRYNDAESETVIFSVVREESDLEFSKYVASVKSKIEKESEIKRQSQLDDIQKFNEWIDKLILVHPPQIRNDGLAIQVNKIISYFVKQ